MSAEPEGGGLMDDRTRGLYDKFTVHRTDGSDAPGGKHDGCDYFVLDLTHDPHARPAIRAYAASADVDGYHALATALYAKVGLPDLSDARVEQRASELEQGVAAPAAPSAVPKARHNSDGVYIGGSGGMDDPYVRAQVASDGWATLAALREPTKAMIEAALREWDALTQDEAHSPRHLMRCVLRAALTAQSEES